MTAAELLEKAERRAAAVLFTRRALPWLIGALLLAGGYCTGTRHTQRAIAAAQYQATQSAIHDTIRVVETRIRVDTQRVTVAQKAATIARASFDSVAAIVEAVADTGTVVPVSLAIPAIATCRDALAADSVLITAQAAAIVDERLRGNAESHRADAAEAEFRTLRPRFGFRSGVAIGVTLAILAAKALR